MPPGVKYLARAKKYRASITVAGDLNVLGEFDDMSQAVAAYQAAKAASIANRHKKAIEEPLSPGSTLVGVPAPSAPEHTTDRQMAPAAADAPVTVGSDTASSTTATTPPPSVASNDVPIPALDAVSSRATTLPSNTATPFIGVVPGATADGEDEPEGKAAVITWEAVITVNGREVSGGEYDTQEAAARAYDALARMYIGADAPTNFPVDPYTSWVPPEEVSP